MADILRITSPVQGKNPISPNRPVNESGAPFDIGGIDRPITSVDGGAGQGSQGGMLGSPLDHRDTSSILMDMLTNPAVTVNFLKNITLLQEVIKLLPANNSSTLEEIQTMFDNLHIPSDQITQEMALQKDLATIFKGPLFEILRQAIQENPTPEMASGVANLLKALNSAVGKREILDSVANNLSFLADRFSSGKTLFTELKSLEMLFRQPPEDLNFPAVKSQVTSLMEEMRGSILLSDKADRVMSILVYNLSRYNEDSGNVVTEALRQLVGQMNDPEAKAKLPELVRRFIADSNLFAGVPQKTSRILDLLSDIISKQANAEGGEKLVNSGSIEKIVHSLLSSPSNFTPLLHMVIPVEYGGLKSYGEIWIDQNSQPERGGKSEDKKPGIQLLMAFDIETIGKFELELMLREQHLNCMLFCPPSYLGMFRQSAGKISEIISSVGFIPDKLEINKMEKQRSLMEVFKSLPYKRTGIDVRI